MTVTLLPLGFAEAGNPTKDVTGAHLANVTALLVKAKALELDKKEELRNTLDPLKREWKKLWHGGARPVSIALTDDAGHAGVGKAVEMTCQTACPSRFIKEDDCFKSVQAILEAGSLRHIVVHNTDIIQTQDAPDLDLRGDSLPEVMAPLANPVNFSSKRYRAMASLTAAEKKIKYRLLSYYSSAHVIEAGPSYNASRPKDPAAAVFSAALAQTVPYGDLMAGAAAVVRYLAYSGLKLQWQTMERLVHNGRRRGRVNPLVSMLLMESDGAPLTPNLALRLTLGDERIHQFIGFRGGPLGGLTGPLATLWREISATGDLDPMAQWDRLPPSALGAALRAEHGAMLTALYTTEVSRGKDLFPRVDTLDVGARLLEVLAVRRYSLLSTARLATRFGYLVRCCRRLGAGAEFEQRLAGVYKELVAAARVYPFYGHVVEWPRVVGSNSAFQHRLIPADSRPPTSSFVTAPDDTLPGLERAVCVHLCTQAFPNEPEPLPREAAESADVMLQSDPRLLDLRVAVGRDSDGCVEGAALANAPPGRATHLFPTFETVGDLHRALSNPRTVQRDKVGLHCINPDDRPMLMPVNDHAATLSSVGCNDVNVLLAKTCSAAVTLASAWGVKAQENDASVPFTLTDPERRLLCELWRWSGEDAALQLSVLRDGALTASVARERTLMPLSSYGAASSLQPGPGRTQFIAGSPKVFVVELGGERNALKIGQGQSQSAMAMTTASPQWRVDGTRKVTGHLQHFLHDLRVTTQAGKVVDVSREQGQSFKVWLEEHTPMGTVLGDLSDEEWCAAYAVVLLRENIVVTRFASGAAAYVPIDHASLWTTDPIQASLTIGGKEVVCSNIKCHARAPGDANSLTETLTRLKSELVDLDSRSAQQTAPDGASWEVREQVKAARSAIHSRRSQVNDHITAVERGLVAHRRAQAAAAKAVAEKRTSDLEEFLTLARRTIANDAQEWKAVTDYADRWLSFTAADVVTNALELRPDYDGFRRWFRSLLAGRYDGNDTDEVNIDKLEKALGFLDKGPDLYKRLQRCKAAIDNATKGGEGLFLALIEEANHSS